MNMNKNGMDVGGTSDLIALMCDKTLSTEANCDLIIPDYLPELRRLLCVEVKVIPPAKYVSPSGVECNGNLDVKITYVGVDGCLYSYSATSEYELSVPCDNGGDFELSRGTNTVVTTVCESTAAKINGGRRVTVKARLRSHVRCYGIMNVECGLYGDVAPDTVERAYGELENAAVYVVVSDPIELDTEIGGLSEGERIASADTVVCIGEVRCEDGCVKVSGYVELKLLAESDGEGVRVITEKLNFNDEVEEGDISDAHLCRVYGKVTDLSVSVEEGKAVCQLSAVLEVVGIKNISWRYTKDVYSTERECTCVTKTVSVPRMLVCQNGNFSQNERISVEDKNLPEGAIMVDHWGTVTFDGCEKNDGKLIFTGQSKYTVIYSVEGEYSSFEVTVPVRYSVDCEGGEVVGFDALGDIVSRRVRLDGNTLAIDSEIAVAVDAFDSNTAEMTESATFGEKYPPESCRMIVCYPSEQQTAWDVAKKYHVPLSRVSSDKGYYLI